MADRETAGLRGQLHRVVTESYSADWQTKVMPNQPGFRTETVYLNDGRRDEQISYNPNGSISKTTYAYGSDGRLAEMRTSWPAGSESTHYIYDSQGRLMHVTSGPVGGPETETETYSYSSDGAKTKVVFIPHVEAKGGAVGWDLRIDGSELGLGAPNGGSVTTAYDSHGCPVESLSHGENHGLIVRVKYVCDEKGHIVEETAEPGHDAVGTLPDNLPEEARAIFQKIFASHLLQRHATHKYDSAGNQIEMTRDSGPRGRDMRRTRFNEHGDKILEESESILRRMDFDRQGAEMPGSVKTHPQHTIVRFEYTYDQQGNWTEQAQWTRAEPNQEEFRSMLVKRKLSYF